MSHIPVFLKRVLCEMHLSCTADFGPPPQNLTVNVVSPSVIKLRWAHKYDECTEFFMITTTNMQSLVAFDQEVHSIGDESTEMTIYGLEEGTEYHFSVARSSSLLVADQSQTVSITIEGMSKNIYSIGIVKTPLHVAGVCFIYTLSSIKAKRTQFYCS